MSTGIMEALTAELQDPEYAAGYAESYALSFIASQIKILREQRGLTQAALATRMKTQQPAVNRLENCNNTPSITTLLKTAEALGLRLHISFEVMDTLPQEVTAFCREMLERPFERHQISRGNTMITDNLSDATWLTHAGGTAPITFNTGSVFVSSSNEVERIAQAIEAWPQTECNHPSCGERFCEDFGCSSFKELADYIRSRFSSTVAA